MVFARFCAGLCIALALLMPKASSQNNPNVGLNLPSKEADIAEPDVAAVAVTSFGQKLLDDVAAHGNKEQKNVFVSPLSVFFALAMTESGAAGRTRTAMRHALAVPDSVSEDALHESTWALLKSLQSQDGVQLLIANALWADSRLPMAASFVERCRQLYQADVTKLDLASPSAADTINAWTKQKTRDQIPQIVKPDQVRAAVAVLTNALYFKGFWQYKFQRAETKEGDFHLSGGQPGPGEERTKKVHFMHRDSIPNGYRSGSGYEAGVLPYMGSDIVLYAILPEQGESPEQALGKVSVANLQAPAEPLDLDIKLPKFTIDFDSSLGDSLMRMGMGPAFQQGADFTPLGSRRFHIDQVLHRTHLEVDEEGTVATAATAVTVLRGFTARKPTKALVFDRPFALLLCDTQTGAVLFSGVIYDPQ